MPVKSTFTRLRNENGGIFSGVFTPPELLKNIYTQGIG
jgi:hypothetical protein